MRRRAVITGLGIVSPIGVGVERFWASALAGRSGIGPPTLFDASKLPRECQIVGEVRDFDVREWMPGAAGKMAGRFSQFAVAAAKMARADARLDEAEIPPGRVKVAIGTSMNGLIDVHQPNFLSFLKTGFISPWACLEFPAHAASSHVAIASGSHAQVTTFASACAAGLDAIAWAAREIESGHATAVLAGGTDTPLSPLTIMAFHAVGVLPRWEGAPEEASRPFDRFREGLVIAEGAAVVVVEEEEHARARGARVYALIAGSGNASESAHLRKVDQSGEVGARAIRTAISKSGLSPQDVDYIAAHGNSMRDYDAAETAAIKRVLGQHAWNVPVSSLKSMCGQALAGSSAMQVVASCLTIRDQFVTPTINYAFPDPTCDLDYVPNSSRRVRIHTVLIHAHSLGGLHSTMVLVSPT